MSMSEIQKSYNNISLSAIDLATLNDIAIGLTNDAIAAKHVISIRGASSRVVNVYRKFLGDFESQPYNPRSRVVWLALQFGIIQPPREEVANV